MLQVKFVVHCKKIRPNDQVKIVGNLPTIGSWNPLNGLVLQQYYDGEWQSPKSIEIPNGKFYANSGQEFDFKIVRIWEEKEVQWEELPNNSNRKFRPKFHAKLILKWSSNIGQVLNEAKSSLKLNGLPGVMFKDPKGAGMLKRNQYKNRKHVLEDSESSEEQNENNSFGCVINRRKSSDIRETMSNGDIDQMYYDTTELQTAYHNYNKVQIHLVCKSLTEHQQFIEQIQEQLRELSDLENYHFKWLLLEQPQNMLNRSRRFSFRKLQKLNNEKIILDDYLHKNVNKNHFIFLDIESALNAEVGLSSACLYLHGNEFKKASLFLTDLQKFQLICFNSGEANKQMFKLFEQKKKESEQVLRINAVKNPTEKEKQIERMSLYKVIQQLSYCQQSDTLSTVHSFTKNQALVNILNPNSILVLDSQLMKIDKKFFENLTVTECEKRLIMIVHKGGMADWMHNFDESKNICVILENFSKLYFVGKLYDPSKKHRDAIQFLKMRAKLCEQQIGGQWIQNNNSFVFKIKEGTQSKFERIKTQIDNFLRKDFNYFKITMKQTKLKISWNLSHPIRLLRTLIRIKCMEQGQIGNFYFVTAGQNFTQMQQQIKLLINVNHFRMINGKHTKIFDFGYGDKTNAKYCIRTDERTLSSSLSDKSEGLNQEEMKEKDKILVN